MKQLQISVLFILLAIGSVQAQTTDKQKGYRKEQAKTAYDELNLSAEQQARIKASREKFKTEAARLKKEGKATDMEITGRRKALHQQYKAEVDAVLTVQQRERLAKLKSEGKAKDWKSHKRMDRGNHAVRAERNNAYIKKQLDLTTEQEAKLDAITAGNKKKRAAIRNDQSLSQEAKRAKMKELMAAQQKEVKAILTGEQVEKIKEARKKPPARRTK